MAKVIISIPTAKGLMFLLGVNFEKSEITMKAPSTSTYIYRRICFTRKSKQK